MDSSRIFRAVEIHQHYRLIIILFSLLILFILKFQYSHTRHKLTKFHTIRIPVGETLECFEIILLSLF